MELKDPTEHTPGCNLSCNSRVTVTIQEISIPPTRADHLQKAPDILTARVSPVCDAGTVCSCYDSNGLQQSLPAVVPFAIRSKTLGIALSSSSSLSVILAVYLEGSNAVAFLRGLPAGILLAPAVLSCCCGSNQCNGSSYQACRLVRRFSAAIIQAISI